MHISDNERLYGKAEPSGFKYMNEKTYRRTLHYSDLTSPRIFYHFFPSESIGQSDNEI